MNKQIKVQKYEVCCIIIFMLSLLLKLDEQSIVIRQFIVAHLKLGKTELQKVGHSYFIKVFFLKQSQLLRPFKICFVFKSTVLFALIHKTKLRLLYYQKKNRSIMTDIRLDDKQYNQNLFWSALFRGQQFLERSERKIIINFQINLLFFCIGRIQISAYTVYQNKKLLNLIFNFVSSPTIQMKTKHCACGLNPINIKTNQNCICQNYLTDTLKGHSEKYMVL